MDTQGAQRMTIGNFGDFGHQTVSGPFKVDLSKMRPQDSVYGMNLQINWIYAFLEDEDGVIWIPERKFNASLSGGQFLMTNQGGQFHMDPESRRGSRGELTRTIEDHHRRWDRPMWHKMPDGFIAHDEQPLVLDLTEDRMEYSEGDLFELAGPSAGLGTHFYYVNQQHPVLYSTICYWMEGTVLGRKVTGPCFFDSVYWAHGLEWKEYSTYRDLQVAILVFANKFEDGSIEWGFQFKGLGECGAGLVIRGDDVIAQQQNMGAGFELDEEFIVKGMHLDIEDTRLEFEAEPGGYVRDYSESRSYGGHKYRAQIGRVRRAGDDRKTLRGSRAWLECFADRIESEGLATAPAAAGRS
jgi:hypothetical protein